MHARTEIIGYLGKDPEMRYTPTGQAVTQFSVATSYSYRDHSEEKVETTTWYRVSAWGKMGEACNQYLKKGSRVYVAGRLVPDKKTGAPRLWQRTDGSWGASYELNASEVKFLSDRQRAGSEDEPLQGGVDDVALDAPVDEMPF